MSKKPILLESLTGELSNQKIHTRAVMIEAGFDPSKIKFKTENQEKLARSIYENTLTFSVGEAGTGKSFISVFTALQLLAADNNGYTKLVLAKSATPIPGQDAGFLPGDISQKLSVFVYSMKSIISEILGEEKAEKLWEQNVIEICALAYIRGSTMRNSIVLIDEGQNLSMHTMRTVLTRIGNDCKMIVSGDVNQSDAKFSRGNLDGLSDALEHIPLIPDVGVVRFTEDDCVRSEIVKAISKSYNERSQTNT